ncbi:hypothetical protein C8J57DRAFT_1222932 [Mycena rebaudengoi]|nr:hypothetical protein C8J57DRAFT_1222932 [Mycena rebaudengoi]
MASCAAKGKKVVESRRESQGSARHLAYRKEDGSARKLKGAEVEKAHREEIRYYVAVSSLRTATPREAVGFRSQKPLTPVRLQMRQLVRIKLEGGGVGIRPRLYTEYASKPDQNRDGKAAAKVERFPEWPENLVVRDNDARESARAMSHEGVSATGRLAETASVVDGSGNCHSVRKIKGVRPKVQRGVGAERLDSFEAEPARRRRTVACQWWSNGRSRIRHSSAKTVFGSRLPLTF